MEWGYDAAAMLGVCTVPYVYFAGGGLFGDKIGMLYILMAALAVLGIRALYGVCRGGGRIRISLTDVFVGTYLLYGIANMLFAGDSGIDRVVVIRWSAILAVYILVRMSDHRRAVIRGLIVLGVIQSSHAYMQLVGAAASHHSYFVVTGMFGNPGQLAGLLCVSAVLACGMAAEAAKWRDRTLWLLAALYICGALWAADSRAGWMALVVGGAYVVYWNTWLQRAVPGKTAVLSLCVVACLVLAAFYVYRPDSADGRVLIWRVSADMIAGRPVFGHGAGSLLSEYMNYQAEYFKSHPGSVFSRFAGNIAYVYNELLHLWIEQGLVGVLLMLGVLGSALFSKTRDADSRFMKGMLLALLVYASFSYPASVFPLLVLYAVAVGGIRSVALWRVSSSRVFYVSVFLIVCMAFIVAGRTLRFYDRVNDCLKDNTAREMYPALRNDVRFMDSYSLYVMDDPDKTWVRHVLEDAARVTPTSGLMCDLGMNYMDVGMYDRAEECFIRASNMVPGRIYPLYCRFLLAKETGDTGKAAEMARRIVAHEVKAESTKSLRIRAEAAAYLGQGVGE